MYRDRHLKTLRKSFPGHLPIPDRHWAFRRCAVTALKRGSAWLAHGRLARARGGMREPIFGLIDGGASSELMYDVLWIVWKCCVAGWGLRERGYDEWGLALILGRHAWSWHWVESDGVDLVFG